MKKNKTSGNILLIAVLFFISLQLQGQIITSGEIDSLTERVLQVFKVPGIAVAVVKDGRVIHAKGYGVRSLATKEKMDANTLFGIASNSKAFTAAALGILVDENKITWQTKVTDIIPEFKMYNPYVTDEFTIADLLTHRSGLGLGAGDLMIFPDGSNFTIDDIIHNLRFLKPVSGFRTKYDYDNLLYIVAGEVVKRVSGTSWENFIENNIMQPLQIKNSAASYNRLKDKSNVIEPHAPVDDVIKVLERDLSEVHNAAGGIYSNINDMSKWLILQMNNGKYGVGNTKQLFSEAVHNDMWTMQTIIPVNGPSSYNTHFAGYGLGWFLSDVKGYKQASHTGGLAGIVTQVTIIPELQLGILVFTNQQSGAAFTAITNTIKDSYLGNAKKDRVQQYRDAELKDQEEAKKITNEIWADIAFQQKASTGKIIDSLYTGIYKDNWFGNIVIAQKSGKLFFESKRSPKLVGELLPYKGNTFVVKWNDRSMDADAYVQFALDNNGKAASIKMKAISPLTDFSFDFHDLDFSRVTE